MVNMSTIAFNARAITLLSVLLLPVCAVNADDLQPKLVSGIYARGHNITEPRPAKSKFLKTVSAGVVIIGNAAGYFLTVRVRKAPPEPMYIRIEYENPTGGPAAVNDMKFVPSATGFTFSSPGAVHGLKFSADYLLTVSVYTNKSDAVPVDVLKQKIRSYVDTTGANIKVFSGLMGGEDAP